MDDEDLDWFENWSHVYIAIEDTQPSVNGKKPSNAAVFSREDLVSVAERIGRCEGNMTLTEDYNERISLIKMNMGNLHLCQLDRGELLRQVGAIRSLLSTLFEVRQWIQNDKHCLSQSAAFHLASVAWRALRDLACGSIGNRNAIRCYVQEGLSGLDLMIHYLQLFDQVRYETMETEHLNLVTAVLGAMRNVSYKTYENCKILHDHGATSLLIWRLLDGTSSVGYSLPSQSIPWRESCFRAAGALLNIAQEYDPCLKSCSANSSVVSILLESWGTNKGLSGLFSYLLQSAKTTLPPDEYNPAWDQVHV